MGNKQFSWMGCVAAVVFVISAIITAFAIHIAVILVGKLF